MGHLVLSRKYRPQGFSELVGQEHVAQTLANAITSGRIGHAYLFVGPRGTGKTTTARIFAKALNCERGPTPTPCGTCDSCVGVTQGNDLDVVEMDAASNNGVDDVRALRDSVGYRPARSRFRIWIVDEVHMLSLPAFNAFLKTLEEPPAQAKFLFCTTEAHKLPETFTSRVQRLEFRRIDEAKMAERLRTLAAREALVVDDGVCERIASGALGGLRDAESLLEQLLSSAQQGRVTLADLDAVTGRAPAERVAAVLEAALAGDAAAALDAAGACLDGGGKPDTVLEQWTDALRAYLVRAARARGAARSAVDERDPAVRFGLPRIARSIDLLLEKRRFLREGADGRLVVEVAAVELARLPSARDLDALIDALRAGGPPPGAPPAAARGGDVPGRVAAGAPGLAERTVARTSVSPSGGGPPPGGPAPGAPRVTASGASPASAVPPGPSAAAATAAGPVASDVGAPTLETVVARWAEFLAVAAKDRRVSSALAKARPVRVDAEALFLALPAGDTFARNTLRDRAGVEGVRIATAAVFGTALRPAIAEEGAAPARVALAGAAAPTTSTAAPPGSPSTPAGGGGPGGPAPAGLVAAGSVAAGSAADDVRRIPDVAALLDALGARVVAVDRTEPAPGSPARTGLARETPARDVGAAGGTEGAVA